MPTLISRIACCLVLGVPAALSAFGCSTSDCMVSGAKVRLLDKSAQPIGTFDCDDMTVSYSQDGKSYPLERDPVYDPECLFAPFPDNQALSVHDAKPVQITVTPKQGSPYAAASTTVTVDHCGGTIDTRITLQPAP